MPSFEIPDGPTTVALKTEGGFHKGTSVFGVTNKTGEGLSGRFSVQVQGCLLYTSPSPRDRQKSRMPSSA